ncbi:hypothetical protein [Altererythrobacter lauratis]|uniref:Uncharacterized protein n=1 Tax=Alteraurantiacibacter lauratis TaxID=2054627 RepID=A0ABV7EJW9_9SPHN
MTRIWPFASTLAGMVILAACGDVSPPDAGESDADSETLVAALARPDPGSCPPPQYAYNEDEFGPRTDPLVIAPALSAIAATDQTNLAVTTLGGGQVCQDASWLLNLGDGQMLQGNRFLALPWGAFEAFGTFLFDRSGGGQVVETGEMPAFSPSAQRLAAIQITQSGFGGLENFVVWRVDQVGLAELHRLPDGLGANWPWHDYDDFRIEGWEGETCVNISAARFVDPAAPRDAFFATENAGWNIAKGSCP